MYLVVVDVTFMEVILNKCKSYATRRWLEHNHKKKEYMVVDAVHEDGWKMEAGGGLGGGVT